MNIAHSSPTSDGGVTFEAIVRQSLEMLSRTLREARGLWIAAAVVLTATDLIDIVFGVVPGKSGFSHLMIAGLIFRLAGIIWISAAAYRTMLGYDRNIWTLDLNVLRYVRIILPVSIAMLILERVISILVLRHLFFSVIADPYTAHWLWLVSVAAQTLIFAALLIKITLWYPALVTGTRLRFVESWRSTRGSVVPLLLTLLVFIVPMFAMHFGVTVWSQHMAPHDPKLIITTVFGGIFSVILLMSIFAAVAATYKLTMVRAALR